MKLDDRLSAVAQQICCSTHVDIGSDHATLQVALLKTGRIEHAIAIENKRLPYENSIRALKGLSAEVRFGDGLNMLEAGEADSLSICGLGAESVRDILLARPQRIPNRVVVEVCQKPEVVRRWGFEHGFHLVSDQTTPGRRPFTILSFKRAPNPFLADHAYENVDFESALTFGPFVLRREDRQFDLKLQKEEAWWRGFARLSNDASARLGLVRKVMNDRNVSPLVPTQSKNWKTV